MNVQQLQATERAFAAIRTDGTVVTWGPVSYGGDSHAVQAQLTNVQCIQVSRSAFATVLGSGRVVTWGDPDGGADSSTVREQLANVQQIQAAARGGGQPCSSGSETFISYKPRGVHLLLF